MNAHTITYDGENVTEVRRWLVTKCGAYEVEVSRITQAITGYTGAQKYTGEFTLYVGQTVVRHPDGTLTVHDAAKGAK